MAGRPIYVARRRRFQELIKDPSFWHGLLVDIAEGQTLGEFCKAQEINYGDMTQWIASDVERAQAYDEAVAFRGDYLGDLVITELRRLVDVDIKDLYDKKGNLLALSKMPIDVRRAIHSLETDETRRGVKGRKVKLYSKEKVIEMLGRYRKLFTDKVEHAGKFTLEDLVGPGPQSPPPKPDAPATDTGDS